MQDFDTETSAAAFNVADHAGAQANGGRELFLGHVVEFATALGDHRSQFARVHRATMPHFGSLAYVRIPDRSFISAGDVCSYTRVVPA